MNLARFNFLNYGDSINLLSKIDFSVYPPTLMKTELIHSLKQKRAGNKYIYEIIKTFGNIRSKRIDLEKFKQEISICNELKKSFYNLKCRGFSFELHNSMELSSNTLREEVNLRMALMPGEELFYPIKVKRYLRRVENNHFFCNGFPSIAFCLGSITPDSWYIFILQSDIALRNPSYIREHFRGWRKILFEKIIEMAKNTARQIYLCRSQDVINACHPQFLPRAIPKSWIEIYDATAQFFKMETVQLKNSINIQTFKNFKPVYTNTFYLLELDSYKRN